MKTLEARPTCAVCQKPVEKFTEEKIEKGVLTGYVVFVAECHGATERQRVRRELLRGLNFGTAFADPNKLPPTLSRTKQIGPR